MRPEREAASNLRGIWQAHDENRLTAGWTAAKQLYKNLGANPDAANYAGLLTIKAFFLADDAELYQKSNVEMEDFFYHIAEEFLTEARKLCGFETESPKYTVQWWKAYRHKDKEATLKGIIAEHETQFGHLPPEEGERYAKLCAERLVTAAMQGHDVRDWRKTDQLLEKYFDIYFEALKKK